MGHRITHQTVQLSVGRHRAPQAGMCAMELASVLAGDAFSDSPSSVSPSIAGVLRGYNDGLDDGRRQTLKPLAASCVGTAGSRAVERRRRRMLRTSFPVTAAGRPSWPAVLRRLTITNPYAAGRKLGRRIASTNDDALHARALALLDELVAVAPTRRETPTDTRFDASGTRSGVG